jgi:hypothetical protein
MAASGPALFGYLSPEREKGVEVTIGPPGRAQEPTIMTWRGCFSWRSCVRMHGRDECSVWRPPRQQVEEEVTAWRHIGG